MSATGGYESGISRPCSSRGRGRGQGGGHGGGGGGGRHNHPRTHVSSDRLDFFRRFNEDNTNLSRKMMALNTNEVSREPESNSASDWDDEATPPQQPEKTPTKREPWENEENAEVASLPTPKNDLAAEDPVKEEKEESPYVDDDDWGNQDPRLEKAKSTTFCPFYSSKEERPKTPPVKMVPVTSSLHKEFEAGLKKLAKNRFPVTDLGGEVIDCLKMGLHGIDDVCMFCDGGILNFDPMNENKDEALKSLKERRVRDAGKYNPHDKIAPEDYGTGRLAAKLRAFRNTDFETYRSSIIKSSPIYWAHGEDQRRHNLPYVPPKDVVKKPLQAKTFGDDAYTDDDGKKQDVGRKVVLEVGKEDDSDGTVPIPSHEEWLGEADEQDFDDEPYPRKENIAYRD